MKRICFLLFFLVYQGVTVHAQTCVNNDPCNLVCNPHMEDLDGDCTIPNPHCYFHFSNGCTNNNGGTGFSNWTTLYGVPFWFGPSTTCNQNLYNYTPLPGDPGGDIGIRNINVFGTGTNVTHNSAFRTDVDVNPNTNYLLSFFRTNLIANSLTPSAGYDVGLTRAADITWNGGFIGNLVTDFSIMGEGTYTGTHWEQVITCFTTDNNPNYNVLYFEGKHPPTTAIQGNKFDKVELIEDRLLDTPTSYDVLCDEPTSIGIDLCTVANLEYQWWDVTNTPVQLTAFINGTGVSGILQNANTNLLPYTVTAVNGIGSIIEISGLSVDRQLELRRVQQVVGQYNIPINNTTCNNAVVPVDLIADCDSSGCPLPAVRTISFTQGDDCVFDFFTNMPPLPGETFTWDVYADGFFDGTGGSHTATFPSNAGYTVNLIITNSCGSITIPFTFRVYCEPEDPCPLPAVRGISFAQADDCMFNFFTNMLPLPGETYTWDVYADGFFDGTGPSHTATFPSSGAYTINLTVTNSCGSITIPFDFRIGCETIEPCPLPAARDIFFSQGSNCYVHDFYTNPVPASLGETVEWDFDNDGIADAGTTTTFPSNGTYTINLILTNSCGTTVVPYNVVVDCKPCSWPKAYGSAAQMETGDGIVVDAQGNVFVHGSVDPSVIFEDLSTVPGGVFLAKYDNCGLLLWVNDVSAYGKHADKIRIDNLGNPIILATDGVPGDTEIEFRLTKFSNSNGSIIWSDRIEAANVLFSPSFDVNMNTNEVYLVANVVNYLKITQADGTMIVNASSPSGSFNYPKDQGYVIKLDASGNQIWQDRTIAKHGFSTFHDVVVGENLDQVYINGSATNHPHAVGEIFFNSNPSIVMEPTATFRLFIASYSAAGNLSYVNMHTTIKGATDAQIEFSNTDKQIYLNNDGKLQLFNSLGDFLSSVPIPGQSSRIHYNQVDNYLLTCGITTTCSGLAMNKYVGTTNTWTYQTGPSPCSSTGSMYGVFADPTTDKIFLTGSFWNGNLSFSATDVLSNAGGRDVFISKIRDLGSSVSYQKGNASSDTPTLDEDEALSAIQVYPNPTSGVVKVKSAQHGRLELLNTIGTTIDQKYFSTAKGSVEFDLTELPAGMYFIKFSDSAGNIEIKKLIKQ